jgi:hypothetical protein
MTRTTHGLARFSLLAALTTIAPAALAQDEAAAAPEPLTAPASASPALPMPTLARTPPASGQATLGAPQAPVIVGGSTVEYGEPMGCGGCGGVHGLGHGCPSVHGFVRSFVPGRRVVRFWGTCKHPLPTLTGPAGYWDSPGPMAGESIVPGAAFDRTPIPIGQMVP